MKRHPPGPVRPAQLKKDKTLSLTFRSRCGRLAMLGAIWNLLGRSCRRQDGPIKITGEKLALSPGWYLGRAPGRPFSTTLSAIVSTMSSTTGPSYALHHITTA